MSNRAFLTTALAATLILGMVRSSQAVVIDIFSVPSDLSSLSEGDAFTVGIDLTLTLDEELFFLGVDVGFDDTHLDVVSPVTPGVVVTDLAGFFGGPAGPGLVFGLYDDDFGTFPSIVGPIPGELFYSFDLKAVGAGDGTIDIVFIGAEGLDFSVLPPDDEIFIFADDPLSIAAVTTVASLPYSITAAPGGVIPEPSSFIIWGAIGLAAIGTLWRRRKRQV